MGDVILGGLISERTGFGMEHVCEYFKNFREFIDEDIGDL
jgi:hypothetical protein